MGFDVVEVVVGVACVLGVWCGGGGVLACGTNRWGDAKGEDQGVCDGALKRSQTRRMRLTMREEGKGCEGAKRGGGRKTIRGAGKWGVMGEGEQAAKAGQRRRFRP